MSRERDIADAEPPRPVLRPIEHVVIPVDTDDEDRLADMAQADLDTWWATIAGRKGAY